MTDHFLEGDVLRRLGEDQQDAGIVGRDEAERQQLDDAKGQHRHRNGDHQHGDSVPHGPVERAIVETEHALEDLLAQLVQPAVR